MPADYRRVFLVLALPPETAVCLKAVKNAVFRSILSRFMSRNQVVSRFCVPAPVPDKYNSPKYHISPSRHLRQPQLLKFPSQQRQVASFNSGDRKPSTNSFYVYQSTAKGVLQQT